MDNKQLEICAKWIDDNKHGGFWTPLVLTARNVDAPNNPRISESDANLVFTVFEERRLMIPDVFVTVVQDKPVAFDAYRFNPDKQDEWTKLGKGDGIWALRFALFRSWAWEHFKSAFIFMVALLITAFLSPILQRASERLSDRFMPSNVVPDKDSKGQANTH